ncbi:MAG: FAD-binding protein [Cytophagaceae bacterium]|nr:FAD-binding protein [Cytophagaceae bacterium]
MPTAIEFSAFELLQSVFGGELFYDNSPLHQAQLRVYATDASVYQEQPVAVALPRSVQDLKWLVKFAREHNTTLIPRAAGTSLAGQVVGSGVVVDISKHFTNILEINPQERYVRVQPGVIRDDLNKALKPYRLMFGPETSTASRAMIGGMVGNNSCGLHSIVWGTTRDHLRAAKVVLSDGSEASFQAVKPWRFEAKLMGKGVENDLETKIYRQLNALLSMPGNQQRIRENFPKPSIRRRNSGYALDALIDTEPFTPGGEEFNLCRLLAGSEGTLAIATELTLNLMPLPPTEVGVVCVHCRSIDESLRANLVALRHKPWASELVDQYILDFTKENPEQRKNRFFIEGNPAAILMVEFFADTPEELAQKTNALVAELRAENLGYAHPVVTGEQTYQVWDVRKAGLGLIRNLPGNTQPVNLIEDCAVDPADLPAYIADLEQLLGHHGLRASFYAHAGAGEIHVEPLINLKTAAGQQKFRDVLADTVGLVKKYRGSLSGEHGDGRLRGEFIPAMMGQEVYELFRAVKQLFDPQGIFNAGKIVDTPPMNQFLRFESRTDVPRTDVPRTDVSTTDATSQKTPKIDTVFDFSGQENILRLTEKCSGSGDCRKTQLTGGTMCPSYMATRNEKDTTRARANILRQFLTESPLLKGGAWGLEKNSPLEGRRGTDRGAEILEVMDLCLSCKGCKTECPSSVDVTKLKAEFLQHYYDAHGVPFRTRMIGNITRASQMASLAPGLYNALMTNGFTGGLAKKMLGFAPQRRIPTLAPQTLRAWFKKHTSRVVRSGNSSPFEEGSHTPGSSILSLGRGMTGEDKRVYLFADEFTNYNDVELGKKAVMLLEALGYEVMIPEHEESGRTYLSKGLVRDAQRIAISNVEKLSKLLDENPIPIIGLEPSAILTLRDEYLELVPAHLRGSAGKVAEHTYLFDEFIAQEIDKGRIRKDQFTDAKRLIKLHGHCHQKALSSLTPTKKLLSLPQNYTVHLIPSGCCGMAGSFGYEAEHYDVSMQIGELVLFPAVREQPAEVLIAAPGTSCRHQIFDGTGRQALHPAEILFDALRRP